ncbi:MFS transporter (plasmid) [Halorussus limi]|uniref:MFS transporter n=1 Tax=Halorussus limi TaxID=2938695 RepID=A0A8U0I0T6_9EURY|nr:MFS transporter [Halorussus limi]UPV76769.1 MFS transporter [Halorussus limi]
MVSLVRRYYLYRATLSPGFYIPVSVIYMEARGLGLADIGFVQGAFLFSMVASELPTGYLGDRLGRRNALAVGSAIVTAVMLGFSVADSTADFAVVYVVWAVGWTFRTGTVDAWLYELLAERDAEDEYARISGRADSALRLVSGITALAASLLYTVDPSVPFLANAGLAALGLPLLATLPTTRGDGEDDRMSVREAGRVLRTQLSRASLRWIVLYAALFNLVFSVTRVFEQPAMRAVGVPVAGLGVLYAGFKLVSAVAASAAGPAQDRLGTRGVLVLLVPVVGVAYASFTVVPVLLVPALFVRRGLQRITRPVRNEYINDRLEDVGRATVLSGVSMALTLASGTANVLGGRVAAAVGPVTFLSVTGVAASLAGGLLWVVTRPIREGTADAAPT